MRREREARQVVGARHGVVHERARKQLTIDGIVDGTLQEGLPDALHDPAVHLSLEQQRIDGAAEVVDDRVALERDQAGAGIDLDLDDVTPVGKGLRRRYAMMGGVEARLHAGRQFGRIERRLGDLE